jgi:hypothetical protein
MPRKRAALKRRTTSRPSDSQLQAQEIADILENCRRAFTGFSEDELAILDGVILEPVDVGRADGRSGLGGYRSWSNSFSSIPSWFKMR